MKSSYFIKFRNCIQTGAIGNLEFGLRPRFLHEYEIFALTQLVWVPSY
jgi:hypothetical protein